MRGGALGFRHGCLRQRPELCDRWGQGQADVPSTRGDLGGRGLRCEASRSLAAMSREPGGAEDLFACGVAWQF